MAAGLRGWHFRDVPVVRQMAVTAPAHGRFPAVLHDIGHRGWPSGCQSGMLNESRVCVRVRALSLRERDGAIRRREWAYRQEDSRDTPMLAAWRRPFLAAEAQPRSMGRKYNKGQNSDRNFHDGLFARDISNGHTCQYYAQSSTSAYLCHRVLSPSVYLWRISSGAR